MLIHFFNLHTSARPIFFPVCFCPFRGYSVRVFFGRRMAHCPFWGGPGPMIPWSWHPQLLFSSTTSCRGLIIVNNRRRPRSTSPVQLGIHLDTDSGCLRPCTAESAVRTVSVAVGDGNVFAAGFERMCHAAAELRVRYLRAKPHSAVSKTAK